MYCKTSIIEHRTGTEEMIRNNLFILFHSDAFRELVHSRKQSSERKNTMSRRRRKRRKRRRRGKRYRRRNAKVNHLDSLWPTYGQLMTKVYSITSLKYPTLIFSFLGRWDFTRSKEKNSQETTPPK